MFIEDLEIVFLIETKMLVRQLERVHLRLQMRGYIGIHSIGLGRGLTLFWKEGMLVSFHSQLVGHLDVNVTFSNGKQIWLTNFCGNPETS